MAELLLTTARCRVQTEYLREYSTGRTEATVGMSLKLYYLL